MNREHSPGEKAMIIAYPIGEALYLNITNRCPNACIFCIRESPAGVGYNLWLDREPTVDEIMRAIGNPASYREIVFCGYGEPLTRPEVVVAVSKRLKESGPVSIRVNTNGLADLILGYDVLPELQGLVDGISISLNAQDAEAYLKLTRSAYGVKAFPAILEFARRCKQYIPKVVLSVVNFPGVDLQETARIASAIGAEFRIREMLGNDDQQDF